MHRDTPTAATEIEDLYRTAAPAMLRLAFVLTNDRSAAEEIVDNAFLRTQQQWSRIANPGGYVRTAVVNACRSYHRHAAVVSRTPLPRPEPVTAECGELDDALSKLSYESRAALTLRYFSGLSDRDIAVTLGLHEATVRTKIHRALARLRKELSE